MYNKETIFTGAVSNDFILSRKKYNSWMIKFVRCTEIYNLTLQEVICFSPVTLLQILVSSTSYSMFASIPMPILEERIVWFILSNISILGVQIVSYCFPRCNIYVYIYGRRLKLIKRSKDFTSVCYKEWHTFWI